MAASNHRGALESVQRILGGLSEQGFYGSVELRFEAGHVVLLRKTESIKPDDYRDNEAMTEDLVNLANKSTELSIQPDTTAVAGRGIQESTDETVGTGFSGR